ncbi:MAG: hypothetical protein A2W99_16815 [Bacteroidetes bacterium GWF2_33_16]|nr:MAG: hypothetical protein A2X00_13980 [Bacteroidetes bacterium GWE2_32_14]OFY03410.1 MAG: hypothetical protein A2W99_16815 [Bacteroidetes bacterium GWF2_33_16]
MTRVLILTNTLKTGGAEKQSIYLYKALKKTYNAQLIVYYGNQIDQRMKELLVDSNSENIIYLKGNHLSKLWFLYKLFKQNTETVCISYLATTNTINAVIGKLAKVKFRIGGIRNSKFHWFKKIIQKHLHNNWLNCSVFNNHNGYYELTRSGFKKEKGIVIFNCIEIPEYIHEVKKDNLLNILTVGRFVEQKDYKTAFLSIKKLIENNIIVKYTIVGQGQLETELKDYVSQIGIDNHVEFIVNPPNVDDYYKNADIYLSTSLFEGLSNSIMEAMSFALPVVATNVGDNKYLVINEKTGFLFPVKDIDRISNSLKLLCNNANFRNEMGEKAYEHIKMNFSVDKFTNEYITLIENLFNGK